MSLSPAAWYRSVGPRQWKSLVAAQLGWMLDAMDVMLYAFALGAIQLEFGLSSAEAGLWLPSHWWHQPLAGFCSAFWPTGSGGRKR